MGRGCCGLLRVQESDDLKQLQNLAVLVLMLQTLLPEHCMMGVSRVSVDAAGSAETAFLRDILDGWKRRLDEVSFLQSSLLSAGLLIWAPELPTQTEQELVGTLFIVPLQKVMRIEEERCVLHIKHRKCTCC